MPNVNLDNATSEMLSKEVFNTSGILAKTELSIVQIQAIAEAKTYAFITGVDILDVLIDHTLIGSKSKERGSMKEFVESLKSLKESTIQKKGEGFKLLG